MFPTPGRPSSPVHPRSSRSVDKDRRWHSSFGIQQSERFVPMVCQEWPTKSAGRRGSFDSAGQVSQRVHQPSLSGLDGRDGMKTNAPPTAPRGPAAPDPGPAVLRPPSSGFARPSSVLWPLAAFSVLWIDLIRQLSYQWSTNEQYAYGWFVPFLAFGLILKKWSDRPPPGDPSPVIRHLQFQLSAGLNIRLPISAFCFLLSALPFYCFPFVSSMTSTRTGRLSRGV
jgi:hypothetical protein